MYRQILVNVRKEHVTYIVCYIAEFCHEWTKEFNKTRKKGIKIFYVPHIFAYIFLIFENPITIEPSTKDWKC